MNLDPDFQLALREKPPGPLAMHQSWRDLTFLHSSCEARTIQELLPEGLTVDTFDGRAWVGLVPFWMTGIRFPRAPIVPGTHTFPETNVRTYVHRGGREPGVWFFSLDASNRIAVQWARRFFGLPYYWSQMSVEQGDPLRYVCRRRDGRASHDIAVKIADRLPNPEPGTLEFFLVERYLLYAQKRNRLWKGRVFHDPYCIQAADIVSIDESMREASKLPEGRWDHVCYSPGVDVGVYKIEPCET